MASPLLENLNPEQLAAVTLPHASALILAGAGSGKTRVLTTRIAWLLATGQANPLSILAVTFTNKAAREMLTRLSALTPVNIRGMWVGTFHGLCNRMLRAHYRDAGLPQQFQIMDMQDQLALIKRVYKAHNINDERFPIRQLQALVNGSKEEGLRPNQVEAHDEFTRRQVEHFALYEQACQREGVVDFPELLLRTFELLSQHQGLRDHYRRRFSNILVDEFQDTNVLQYKWLKLLTGPDTSVFAVGDDDQSIYAFRGANVANMQHFERDFAVGGEPVKLIKLEQNYRSHGNILDAANALIKQNQGRLGKNLWTDDAAGEPVRAFTAPSDIDEAAFIVDVVNALVERRRVARRDRGSLSLQRAVARRRARVVQCGNAVSRLWRNALFRARGGQARTRLSAPARVSRGRWRFPARDQFPAARASARDRSRRCRSARRLTGTSLWTVACSRAVGGKAGSSLVAFVTLIESMRAATQGLKLPEVVEHVMHASGLLTHYGAEKDGQERIDNLQELVNAADSFVREVEREIG